MEELDKKIEERNEALAKKLIEYLEPHLPAIQTNIQKFGRWLEQIKFDFAPILKAVQVDWAAVQKRLENLPARAREAVSTASEQGWFFNWQNSLRDTVELIEKLGEAGAEEADEILKKHFTSDFDWYVKLITDMYPVRKNAIEAAASAHKRGDPEGYYLSIPVFLAQADGILSEITGLQQPMSGRNGKIRGSTYVSEKIGDNQDAKDLLHQIINLSNMSLLKSKGDRDKESIASGKTFNALNRHQVIHGEVSDYGTELNSLKAFSFLIYIAAHVPETLESARLKKSIEPSSQ